MNAQQTELSYTQMATIDAAMSKKGHRAGRVRYSYTRGGKVYAYVACANTNPLINHLGTVINPAHKCSTEAEYSIDRDRLTKSTVAYKCGGN